MTPEEFAAKLSAMRDDDTETRHIVADELMCKILRELGYEQGIDIYESWTRWHA